MASHDRREFDKYLKFLTYKVKTKCGISAVKFGLTGGRVNA